MAGNWAGVGERANKKRQNDVLFTEKRTREETSRQSKKTLVRVEPAREDESRGRHGTSRAELREVDEVDRKNGEA